MTHFDVFNGDADGICSLLQLRLETPLDAVLITGPKRDIALLPRVNGQAGDSVTALDVSLAVNRDALLALLQQGITVEYFDHHFPGDQPEHSGFAAHIDTASDVCTGILVDRHLEGRQRVWAVVAAFGDNLAGEAVHLAATLGLHAAPVVALRELGETLAYNAYGDTVADLVAEPGALYECLRRWGDPFLFMRKEPVFRQISEQRRLDLDEARQAGPAHTLSGASVYVLPDAPSSRRVRGVFSNALANAAPERAHAVLTPNAQGGYTVSLRAPQMTREGADLLCRQYPTGGGRSAAAGIDQLPANQLDEFICRLDAAFS